MIVTDAREERDGARLITSHYDELRRIARRIVTSDGQRHAFQPTELVNEAALRLIRSGLANVQEREHLLALAARTMRRVLIDESRKANAGKRHMPTMMTRWSVAAGRPADMIDLEQLDRAIAALERFSADHARIVELRFGLGLTVEETARTTGIPERTVKRRWQAARVWLQDHMTGDGAG